MGRNNRRKLIESPKIKNGQILILVALMLVVLLGGAVLAIDAGANYLTKTELQNAADAAALAGARELPDNPTKAENSARQYAIANGIPGDSLTITMPTDHQSIKIAINRTSPTFFAKIFGVSTSTIAADATASVGIAASVPWIVPFVIPKPTEFSYDHVYVMRMYGAGDFLDYPSTGYPSGYSYPSDYRTDPDYKDYPLSSPYPSPFDYMNVYIKKNTNFNDYINWLENGYHETFSIDQNMYYYAPSSGGQESVDAFQKRLNKDTNTDYTKAKIGDARVILIPVVNSMLKRTTKTNGTVPIKIIGFVGFFIQEVHKNTYGASFWFEGRFLEDLVIGTGEVTYDPNADFGLRVIILTE
jgi:hypothetical protein